MKKSINNISYIDRVKNNALFTLSLVMFVMSIILLALSIYINRSSKVTVAVPAQPFSIGQTITMGSTAVTVDNVTFTSGSGSFTAPSDKNYAVVDVTVSNKIEKPITIIPTADTYMKGSDGTVYYLTPISLGSPFRAGDIPVGEQVKGQLSCLIPKGISAQFYIDSAWSGGVIVYDVLH